MNQMNDITMKNAQLRLELPALQFEFDALKLNLTEMRRQLNVASRLNSRMIESATESIVITDARNIIRTVNPAFEKSTGYSAAEAIGRTPAMLKSGHHNKTFYREMWSALSKTGQWRGEIWNRYKSGEINPEWLSISAVKDSQQRISHYVGIFSNTHPKEYIPERLRHLAFYDGLTELPNKHLFMDRLNMSLSRARRDKQKMAVMFIDLDRFKQINDTLGYKIGDELLIGVTERMKLSLRDEDTLARLASDEFAVILPGLPHPDAADGVARKFIECCTQPFEIDGHELNVTASIGIGIYPNDGEDAGSLLRQAEFAMRRVKESGRNGYLHCSPEMRVPRPDRMDSELNSIENRHG